MTHFFSIITVCKDNLAGLKETSENLQAQTNKNWEWIVVDGASTDGTVEWLTSRSFERMNWVSEPDRGIYDAMNKGSDQASGEYLIYMNSGDCFYGKDRLQLVADAIIEGGYPDLIYGGSMNHMEHFSFYKKPRAFRDIWLSGLTMHQAMAFKRRSLGSERYDERFPICADYALLCRLSKREAFRAITLDAPICLFQLGGYHEQHLLKRLKEDWQIQRDILEVKWPYRLFVYLTRLGSQLIRKVNTHIHNGWMNYFKPGVGNERSSQGKGEVV